MKGIIVIIFMLLVFALMLHLASCSKKIHCLTQKTVPVTFIKDGRSVTVAWKYCDTCLVGKKGEIPVQK